MKKFLLFIMFHLAILAILHSPSRAQEAGERYTFIAKDGSQIINVLLVQETEDSYTVRIGQDRQEISIPKKSIEKLILPGKEKIAEFRPVPGKKSGPPAEKKGDAGEKTGQDEGMFDRFSLTVTVYGITSLSGNEAYHSRGWGGEILPLIDLGESRSIQGGGGLSYSRMASSTDVSESRLSMASIFGYLQVSHAPGFLSFPMVTLRPFAGAAFGGAMSYRYSRPLANQSSGDGQEIPYAGMKNFSVGAYYGFRGGIGFRFGKNLPLEFLAGCHYIMREDRMKNLALVFAGINLKF